MYDAQDIFQKDRSPKHFYFNMQILHLAQILKHNKQLRKERNWRFSKNKGKQKWLH
jgi:hypothetical protein